MANYGVAIAPPSRPREEDLPPGLQQPSSSSENQSGEAPLAPLLPPAAIPATTNDVEEWMGEFQPLRDISLRCPPEVGDSILWRGLKIGPHGQQGRQRDQVHHQVTPPEKPS